MLSLVSVILKIGMLTCLPQYTAVRLIIRVQLIMNSVYLKDTEIYVRNRSVFNKIEKLLLP